eukprot:Partr_v1_DN27351_c1_g1_i2_m46283 putative Radial spoke
MEDPVDNVEEAVAVPVIQEDSQAEEASIQPVAPEPLDAALNISQSKAVPVTSAPAVDYSGKFASSKASLQQTPVYDHLSHLIMKILQVKPADPYRDFEALSHVVKKERDFAGSETVQPQANTQALHSAEQTLQVVRDSHSVTAESPDFLALASLFSQAGINISQEETYRLMQGLKRIEQIFECKSVRLFGKVMGTTADYYVVESERTSTDSAETVGPVEMEQGVGCNKYVYFVSTNGLDGWRRLPDAQPIYIQLSRRIRKLLTGDLDRAIVSQPPFAGTEADYLRALIARIGAATVVSPGGYYRFDEDEADDAGAPLVLNTDFEWPNEETLSSLENWTHHIPYILPQGRTVYVKPADVNGKKQTADDDDQEQEEEEDTAVETGPPLLSPLSEDASLKDRVPAWTIKHSFQHLQPKQSAIVLRNNLWPGAVTVGFNDKFANIYIGWGVKDLQEQFIPEPIGTMQREYQQPTDDDTPPNIEQDEQDPPPPEQEEKADDQGEPEDGEAEDE